MRKPRRPDRFVACLLCAALLLPAPAALADTGYSLGTELPGAGGGASEFVSGNFPGAVLMPVNLWGGVSRTGIHHIPTRTDLITLLSLAGGPTSDAELDNITIKRRSRGEEQILKVDAEEYLNHAGKQAPVLEANDIIMIPRHKPPINQDTMTTMSFVSSLMALILGSIVFVQVLKK